MYKSPLQNAYLIDEVRTCFCQSSFQSNIIREVNKTVEVSFSHYFSKKDIREFDEARIGKYKIKVKRLSKPDPDTGGLIWYGIIIFLGSGIASGFLQELGKDLYNSFKEKLFKKGQKLRKVNIEKFTINIQQNQSMIFFHLTSLDRYDFNDALKKLSGTFEKNKPAFTDNPAWYELRFDKKSKSWKLKKRNLP